MNKYHFGIIYKIISPNTNKVYIGSTTTTKSIEKCSRWAHHRSVYKRYNKIKEEDKKGYCKSILIFECGNAYIEVVEKYKCKDRIELEKREGDIMLQTQNIVNKIIPGRTSRVKIPKVKMPRVKIPKDKNHKKKVRREYYLKNREKLLLSFNTYWKNNKEKITKRKNEYYKKNPQKLEERKKKHSEYCKERNKRKYTCLDCGDTGLLCHKLRHERSKKHKKMINKN